MIWGCLLYNYRFIILGITKLAKVINKFNWEWNYTIEANRMINDSIVDYRSVKGLLCYWFQSVWAFQNLFYILISIHAIFFAWLVDIIEFEKKSVIVLLSNHAYFWLDWGGIVATTHIWRLRLKTWSLSILLSLRRIIIQQLLMITDVMSYVTIVTLLILKLFISRKLRVLGTHILVL